MKIFTIYNFRFGLLEHWQRGDTQENYSYDKNGRLVTIQHSNSTYLAFTYNDRDTMPSKVFINLILNYGLISI